MSGYIDQECFLHTIESGGTIDDSSARMCKTLCEKIPQDPARIFPYCNTAEKFAISWFLGRLPRPHRACCYLTSVTITWATFLRDGYAKVFTPLVNLLTPVIWLRCNAIKGQRFFDLVDSEGRDWRVGYHPYLRRYGCCQDSSGANESHPNCENWSESPRRDGRT